jgi:4-amino-4-deoxy-L-arabinose transferase-like glycosyltransferase
MFSAIGRDEPNPPLFFIVAWPWAKVFGTSEAGLRSFSALVGTAVVPLTYLCGRELVSRRTGLLAAAFAAVNPFMIWYSQEAREYMLLAALCTASFLLFARAWRTSSTRTIVWWGVVSALALMTQYFAAFLVWPEALALLWRGRRRTTYVAVIALVVVQGVLLPHAIHHSSHPAGWIDSFPLSIRIQQVPVAFGMGTLYLSSLVSYGLVGAAILAACMIVLLVVGADRDALRGAGLAAALAAVVLLAPLVLALVGHDYYEARALMPAWTPLAVAVAAACTVPRLRGAGMALAAALVALFVYAGVRIDGNARYQRADWRGVARALGPAPATRAIVAYDGTFATAPLALYLPHVAWTGSRQVPQTSQAPVSVGEVDVVGNVYQRVPARLPQGVRVLGSARVGGYRIERFAVAPAWRRPPAEIGAAAPSLLGPAAPTNSVLIQTAG